MIDDKHARSITDDLIHGRFTFLGQSLDLGGTTNWTPHDVTYLWVFNLHYFEYFEALRVIGQNSDSDHDRMGQAGASLIKDWIDHHPYPNWPGWEPYPIAERLIHWQRFLADYPQWRDDCIRESTYKQVHVLGKMVEHDLANNHVLVNLAGLLAGLSMLEPTGELKRLHLQAASQLKRALADQLTEDGTLVERSAMYHSLVLTKLLAIYPLHQGGLIHIEGLDRTIPDMVRSLGQYRFGNGGLVHFHDSADGIVPGPDRLANAAAEMDITAPPESVSGPTYGGGLVWARRDRYECVIDAAGPAPRRNPGHCHASIGSYILHWAGQPLVIDPGCSTYDAGEVRSYERSTGAHNTVCVNDLDQSEVWDRFRIARRASVTWRDESEIGGYQSFALRHDGYDNRTGVQHTRRFVFGDRFVLIVDRLDGPESAQGTSLLTLAPGVAVSGDAQLWSVAQGEHEAAIWANGWRGELQSVQSAVQFGVRTKSAGLKLTTPLERAGAVALPWVGMLVLGDSSLDVAFDRKNYGVRIENESLRFDGMDLKGTLAMS